MKQNLLSDDRYSSRGNTYIVYDDSCPFCSRYVKLLCLDRVHGFVEVVSARSDHVVAQSLRSEEIDLNEGMVLVQDAEISHGAECIHKIAHLSTSSNLFNRVNAFIFRSRTLSRWLYPIMKLARNASLKLLGRSKISTLGDFDRVDRRQSEVEANLFHE